MSRLTDLIAQTKANDPDLGQELEREFKALAARRAFGLNFERHKPETVELPGRPVRKGDKVRILPPRGSAQKGDRALWRVVGFEKVGVKREAKLETLGGGEPAACSVQVADLVVVAEFRDYIYPGLVSTGKVARGGDKPFHTVINGENFHALEALTFTHRGKIDVIYIDPPYNSGARDWKYNNDYVEKEDLYRHSKWLAMMERRLLVARDLLNLQDSALIVTIDEKEYLRLGLLLEQVFPEARMQMITSVINPKGVPRDGFSRLDEYLFILQFGSCNPQKRIVEGTGGKEVRWRGLTRSGSNGVRSKSPGAFYPIFFNAAGRIESVGDALPLDQPASTIKAPKGLIAVWPTPRPDGTDGRWSVTPKALRALIELGAVRTGRVDFKKNRFPISYLTTTQIEAIRQGNLVVKGRDPNGSLKVYFPEAEGRASSPKTVWNHVSHSASEHGSGLLLKFLPGRKFPYPKSLYAVEDVLEIFVRNRPAAIVLDFFAGSGTTAHAVMRLNHRDGGSRQSISITNNEVGADEQAHLVNRGLRPSDAEWEALGICDHITKPRIASAILGTTPDGERVEGDYAFNDEFPMAEGLEENAEFFTLSYETPIAVSHNRAFERIAPLLWMRAGSQGKRIARIPTAGWSVEETHGLLTDLDAATPFLKAVAEAGDRLRLAYIVTDDERRFQSIVRQLPSSVEPVRLYESYLTNFRFSMGR